MKTPCSTFISWTLISIWIAVSSCPNSMPRNEGSFSYRSNELEPSKLVLNHTVLGVMAENPLSKHSSTSPVSWTWSSWSLFVPRGSMMAKLRSLERRAMKSMSGSPKPPCITCIVVECVTAARHHKNPKWESSRRKRIAPWTINDTS